MKRIFVLSRETMFGEGIKTLLSMENEIKMVQPNTDIETAVQCIRSSQPDIIIFNCDDSDPEINAAVMTVLRERMGISVLGISLQDNSISIHRGERKQVRDLEDLFEAIYAEK